jgi:hypothetical protein
MVMFYRSTVKATVSYNQNTKAQFLVVAIRGWRKPKCSGHTDRMLDVRTWTHACLGRCWINSGCRGRSDPAIDFTGQRLAHGSSVAVAACISSLDRLGALTRLRGFALENADFEIFSTAK